MEDALQQLGLSKKEARMYIQLLEGGATSAADLAYATKEKRTNVYALLEALTSKGLVVSDAAAVRRYGVAEPGMLRRLLQVRQDSYQHAASALQAALPAIRSQYALTIDKPGVVHLAGDDGILRLLDDMANASSDVLLVASNDVPQNPDTLLAFRKRLVERSRNGVATRALFHLDENAVVRQRQFAERGIELRFLGSLPFAGEVAIYDNNVAFTVYEPSIVVTVITNELIAQTMTTLFEVLWAVAEEAPD